MFKRNDTAQAIPARAGDLARRLLVVVLNAFDAGSRASEIEEIPIAAYRLLLQRLPLRVYVYTLDNFMGKMEFEAILRSDRPVGAVFDAFELSIDGVPCGFYVYSLEAVSDSSLLRSLWTRLRREVGEEVRPAALPEAHTRHQQPDFGLPSNEYSVISMSGNPEEVAERLIRDSLPKTTLDQIDLGDDQGLARLFACLLLRQHQASLEKDEILRFVERNESSLRAGRLELLQALAMAGDAVEGGEQLVGFLKYFSKQIEAALAGRPQDIDVKSDRLLWLLYAMAHQIADETLSSTQALAILSKPQHRNRISHLSLLFMLKDFAEAIGTPNQTSTEYVLLILECALMSADEPAVSASAFVVAKLDAPKDTRWLLDVLARARAFLAARGRAVAELDAAITRYRSRFGTSIADEDL